MNLNILFKLIVTLCVFTSDGTASAQSISIGEVFQSAIDTGKGIIDKIPEAIPSPETIFASSKNLIAGYPFAVAFKAINLFCSAALSSNTIKPKILPEVNELNFVLFTKNGNFTIPIQSSELVWKHKEFDSKVNVTIVVTGWTTSINESNGALDELYAAYKCRGKMNFIGLDTAKFVDTLYTWSAFNTEEIGKILAVGLEKLVQYYPLENIHLIGHSLGAHIVGAAGRQFSYLTSKLLPRITGLDPANPCFNEGEALAGLSRGDAEFVDVIHSDPGALGKRAPVGDADFFPNGLNPLPPGCFSITCAHARSYEYYAETVYPGNENGFLGVKCNSLAAANSGFCNGQKYAMGFSAPANLKGNLFLKTSAKSPFGEFSKDVSSIKCNSDVY